jgi:hypothetical protein
MVVNVIPYSETTGSEKFKEFLAKPFTVDMLYPVFNDKSVETLFEGWRGKDMINWYRFSNDNKIILEFYPTYYTLRKDVKDGITYMLSIPITIDDFINDMKRFGVQLQWTTWIDENFEPKEYLRVDEIKNYWTDLLAKMGKSHELL